MDVPQFRVVATQLKGVPGTRKMTICVELAERARSPMLVEKHLDNLRMFRKVGLAGGGQERAQRSSAIAGCKSGVQNSRRFSKRLEAPRTLLSCEEREGYEER
jgi:hypothetical protein